jgi:prepilin-type N-terminal cleavage/methylation domain-containing protein
MVLKRGYTLVELLIVMSIVVVLALMMIGILNPRALVGRANDGRRKKDLARIKVAFEEYYNDKGCYPVGFGFNNFVCDSDSFAPWLTSWPCDPQKNKYLVATEEGVCPKWYKVTAKLENLNDPDIPAGWTYNSSMMLGGSLTAMNSNYGVSSANIKWSDIYADPFCAAIPRDFYNEGCYSTRDGACNSASQCGPGRNQTGCKGSGCFLSTPGYNCRCPVPCCGQGCLSGVTCD